MKISSFRKVISPEVGTLIAGYDFNSASVMKSDELYMTGLCLDDGERKALILCFDLLALDGHFVRSIRKECASLLQTTEEMILLTCTHNHSGPEAATPIAPNHDKLNVPYVNFLRKQILQSVAELKEFRECDITFYSANCNENRNRRYVSSDNQATFQPHRREMIPLCDGFTDQELFQLNFYDPATGHPLYVIGNFAAHPLAGHAPGLGGIRISADYPGAFREYVTAETGAECMFVNGAAGDMVPLEDELGSRSAKEMGIRLGKAAIGGVIDSARNKNRFLLNAPRLGGKIGSFTVPIRKKYVKRVPPEYQGKESVTLEIQCLSIGDICLVGMPGEVCAELGQEIKWHTPFRKAMIAYYATSDFSYMCPANFLVSGGYEGSTQQFGSAGGFELVKCAVEMMNLLRQEIFPEDYKEEFYPDHLDQPYVNIPAN